MGKLLDAGVAFAVLAKPCDIAAIGNLRAIDPLDYKHIHNHQICRAYMGDAVGIATLETVCFGRHDPSGFESILDGAR